MVMTARAEEKDDPSVERMRSSLLYVTTRGRLVRRVMVMCTHDFATCVLLNSGPVAA